MVFDKKSNQGSSKQRPLHTGSSFCHLYPAPNADMLETSPSIDLGSKPFRLFDLPYETRSQIFFFSICSTDNYWLDREVISLGESLRLVYFIRGRVVWRGSNGVFLRLLLSSRLIYNEVTQMLFSRFAFDARGWGYMLKYSDPSKRPSSNYLPKHRIKHIVYTPYRTEYLREHQDSAKRILSSLPMLCTVRIMISWECAQGLVVCGNTKVGTMFLVDVARLFRDVGKVAVVGRSICGALEQSMVMEARQELEDEPWYWDMGLDYPLLASPCSYMEKYL